MFRFQNTFYFYFLAVVPVLMVLAYIALKIHSEKIKKLFKPEIYNYLTKNLSQKKRNIKFILEIFVLILMVLSLARPQLGESSEKIKMEGIEIIFALDVSNSMLAEDLKPSRLEVAKRTIDKLLERIPGYKVGLIAFAGNAGLVSPLTTDYSALKTFLETTNTTSVSEQGTDFSNVIDTALEAFNRGGADTDELSKVTRVIVILSDGEDQESKAIKKVKLLVDKGIRIFTVATGTAQGAPIPQRDDYGQLQGYKKDKGNQVVVSKVNVNFMRELAQAGKGASYNASFSGDEVRDLERDLNKLEKTEFESDFMKKYDERFQIPLMLAFILLIFEMLLTEKKQPKEVNT